MKIITLFFLILISTISFGQAFHFDYHSRTLIKTTNQSPAHWYIEIFNDSGVDTTLRWKSRFVDVPIEWNMSLDDQNVYHSNLQDNDSADFTLYSGLAIPQKLIIGATLNDTPGDGYVYFDVYDPNDPANFETIFFRFIITEETASQIENVSDTWINQIGDSFQFDELMIGEELNVFNSIGQKIYSGKIEPKMTFSSLCFKGQVFFLTEINGEIKTAKFYFN